MADVLEMSEVLSVPRCVVGAPITCTAPGNVPRTFFSLISVQQPHFSFSIINHSYKKMNKSSKKTHEDLFRENIELRQENTLLKNKIKKLVLEKKSLSETQTMSM